jgi:Skp family chaperone for outer membrane proteins
MIAGAEEQIPLFGYVNVSQALAFHPVMAKMDVRFGRFDPAALGSQAPGNRDQARQDLAGKRKVHLELRTQLEKELAQIDTAYQGRMKELSPLQQRLNSLPASAQSPFLADYQKRKAAIDQDFWKKRVVVQEKLTKVESTLKELIQENDRLHLTTLEETQKVFKLMLDDIYEAIESVAKHYKVAFVINSSFTVERLAVQPGLTDDNPLPKFFATPFPGKPEEALMAHGSDGTPPLIMSLSYWNASQRWAFQNCLDPRLDRMFVKGGVNMTSAVVDLVYQKHKIDQAHREIVGRFLESGGTK